MRVLLLSAYDLGRQPFGLASPAAFLARARFDVDCLDLAVEALDESRVRAAGLIAIHLPMHTATRLAARLIPRLRLLNPGAPLCCYGLYAAPNREHLEGLGAAAVFGGEFEGALVEFAEAQREGGPAPRREAGGVSLERLDFAVPDRGRLPDPDRYARLTGLGPGAGERLTGYTEASRGCKHRCRHCPVVPVYGGRFRIVPR